MQERYMLYKTKYETLSHYSTHTIKPFGLCCGFHA